MCTRWFVNIMDDSALQNRTRHRPIDDDTRSESGDLDNDTACKLRDINGIID